MRIAIVGATGLVGEALRKLFVEREFPHSQLLLVASEDSAGTKLEFAGTYHLVHDLAAFDFSKVQLAFFAVPATVSARYVPRALAAGCRVIDAAPRHPDDNSGIYILPEINGHVLENAARDLLIISPDPAARILALLINALDPFVDITQVHAVVHESVARYGKGAVDELAQQSIALFNMKDVPKSRFPAQVAFNLMPPFGDAQPDDNFLAEQSISKQVQFLTGRAQEFITVSRVLVSAFHGTGITVHISSSDNVEYDDVIQAISAMPTMKYSGEDSVIPAPSFITHGSGTDFVCIGNLRTEIFPRTGLRLFAVADGVRAGIALNCVMSGEILVKNSF